MKLSCIQSDCLLLYIYQRAGIGRKVNQAECNFTQPRQLKNNAKWQIHHAYISSSAMHSK